VNFKFVLVHSINPISIRSRGQTQFK